MAVQLYKLLVLAILAWLSFVNVKVIFQNTRCIKSFFPYKGRLNRSELSEVIYKASCWNCNDFYIGKTKRRLHDRKRSENGTFQGPLETWSSAHVKTYNWSQHRWDHFNILVSGKTDYHCKVKETLSIQELQLALNVNVSSEKLLLFKKAFPSCHFTDSFRLKRLLKILPQMFSV